MPLVLDSSISLVWAFDDEDNEQAASVVHLLDSDVARVSAIWPLEMTNALVTGERRGRINESGITRFRSFLRTISIEVDPPSISTSFDVILDLARQYNLTTHDASYLELAQRFGLPLATLDRRLREAAQSMGIALVLK
jgi:predicted nucleic acid-binding protein